MIRAKVPYFTEMTHVLLVTMRQIIQLVLENNIKQLSLLLYSHKLNAFYILFENCLLAKSLTQQPVLPRRTNIGTILSVLILLKSNLSLILNLDKNLLHIHHDINIIILHFLRQSNHSFIGSPIRSK